jgi:hypothetical protein
MASGSQPLGSIDWNDPVFANPDSPSPARGNFYTTGEAGYAGNTFGDFWYRMWHGVPSPDEVAAAKAAGKQDVLNVGGTQAQADASAAAMQAQIDQSAADNPTNIDNVLNPFKNPVAAAAGVGALILILLLIVIGTHEVKTF